MPQKQQYIYIRQSTGLCYQHPYHTNQKIQQILLTILKKQIPNKLRAFNKGRVLQINQSLSLNNIKPNQIIHLHPLSRSHQETGFIYINYQNKVYRVLFSAEQIVREFKKRIQQQIGLDHQLQIILFNSIKLENSKLLKDYQIRTNDFLSMAKFVEVRHHVLDIPQVIYPKKNIIQKRRSSQCFYNNQYPYCDIDKKIEGKSLEGTQKLFQTKSNQQNQNTIFGLSSTSDLVQSINSNNSKHSSEIVSESPPPNEAEIQTFYNNISRNRISEALYPNNLFSKICNKQLELSQSLYYKDTIKKTDQQNLYLSHKNIQQNRKKIGYIVPKITFSAQLISIQ